MRYTTYKNIQKRSPSAPILYVDMDGCLCKWQEASEEELRRAGYFKTRPSQDNLVEAVRMLSGVWNVQILSAVIEGTGAEEEKKAWLSSHGLGHVDAAFIPDGSVKARYVSHSPGPKFLLDDYSKNLREWAGSGHIGIKFRNGINGTKGTWKGCSVDHTMSAEEIFRSVNAFILEEKEKREVAQVI